LLERETILTPAGFNRLKSELNTLKITKRKEVTDKIREALEFGDPWGNPEYEMAKQEQAFVEGRIKSLESLLENAKVVKQAKQADTIQLGSKVTVFDLEAGDEYIYIIVGSGEADPINNKISYKSPVAQALLGHRAGDVVEAECPIGVVSLKVLEVSAAESELVNEEVS